MTCLMTEIREGLPLESRTTEHLSESLKERYGEAIAERRSLKMKFNHVDKDSFGRG